jgi:hypothetical protein
MEDSVGGKAGDFDALVPRRSASDQVDRAAPAPKRFGEEFADRLVGRRVDGWGGDTNP